MITKTIGGISFELKEDFDFSFLSEYGTVFAVFDQQDSGYLCFGVKGTNEKLFLKMAGAAPLRSHAAREEAVARLQSTVRIYEDLKHPALLNMIAHREIGGGYLTVFEWFDGVCMGKQYGSFDRFIAMPLDEKLTLYDEILRFHIHANKRGYIAVDFYDGCIMYDFRTKQTRLCDIELYGRKPVVNTMGRMWGSSRFMSPEEFQLGAEIDERSNVFAMGATAFQLFGGGVERDQAKWQADEKRYTAALKAVKPEKDGRYPSIEAYVEAWNAAGY